MNVFNYQQNQNCNNNNFNNFNQNINKQYTFNNNNISNQNQNKKNIININKDFKNDFIDNNNNDLNNDNDNEENSEDYFVTDCIFNRKYNELSDKDLLSNILIVAKEQAGCRFLQQKLRMIQISLIMNYIQKFLIQLMI